MLRDLLVLAATAATIMLAVMYANANPTTWWISVIAMCAVTLCCLAYLTVTGDDL